MSTILYYLTPQNASRLNKFSGHKKKHENKYHQNISDILLLSCFVLFYSLLLSISVSFLLITLLIDRISRPVYIIIPYKDMHC